MDKLPIARLNAGWLFVFFMHTLGTVNMFRMIKKEQKTEKDKCKLNYK